MSNTKTTDALENVLYNISGIHEDFAKDKSELTKQIAKLDGLLKELAIRVVELENANKGIQKETLNAIEKAEDKLSEKISAAATLAIKYELGLPVARFESVLAESSKALSAWKQAPLYNYFLWGIMALFVCFITSVITARVFLPTPTSPFTDTQLRTYGNGKFIERIMDKLPPQELQRLEAIGKGEGVPKFGTALIGAPKEEVKKSVHVNKRAKYRHRRTESAKQDDEDTTDSGDKEQKAKADNTE